LLVYPDAADGSLFQYPESFTRHAAGIPVLRLRVGPVLSANFVCTLEPKMDRVDESEGSQAIALNCLRRPTPTCSSTR